MYTKLNVSRPKRFFKHEFFLNTILRSVDEVMLGE
jgi:hypothetical protein